MHPNPRSSHDPLLGPPDRPVAGLTPALSTIQGRETSDWLTLFASVSPRYQVLLRAALASAMRETLPPA